VGLQGQCCETTDVVKSLDFCCLSSAGESRWLVTSTLKLPALSKVCVPAGTGFLIEPSESFGFSILLQASESKVTVLYKSAIPVSLSPVDVWLALLHQPSQLS
jgi:hypothetical protein